MKTTLVRFKTKDYLCLDGLLFEPDKKTNRIVIHVHGNAGDFYRNRFIEDFSSCFTQSEYAFLTFNNRGAGLEYRFYKEKNDKIERIIIGSKNEVFDECLLDIDAAIAFAEKSGYSEIVLQGHSLGCNKVIWYVIKKKFSGKVILLAPCDVARINEKFLLSNADIFRYRNSELLPSLTKLCNSILIVIGSKDKYIEIENKQECIDYLSKAFKKANIKAKLVSDGNHNYDGKCLEVANTTVNWLKEIHG